MRIPTIIDKSLLQHQSRLKTAMNLTKQILAKYLLKAAAAREMMEATYHMLPLVLPNQVQLSHQVSFYRHHNRLPSSYCLPQQQSQPSSLAQNKSLQPVPLCHKSMILNCAVSLYRPTLFCSTSMTVIHLTRMKVCLGSFT